MAALCDIAAFVAVIALAQSSLQGLLAGNVFTTKNQSSNSENVLYGGHAVTDAVNLPRIQ